MIPAAKRIPTSVLAFAAVIALISGALVAADSKAGGATPVRAASASAGPLAHASKARKCGTYASTSIYATARVTAIRGVKCGTAMKVARAYDQDFKQIKGYVCGLSHGGGKRLFSCGKGGGAGSLGNRKHALKATGVGSPSS